MASGSLSKPYNNSSETLSLSNLTSGFTYTLNKKGDMFRIDCGVDANNAPACSSGNNTIGVLPTGARPSANLYFPALYRIPNNNAFYITYGVLYANGNVVIYCPSAATIRQLVLGQTYYAA